MPSFGWWSWGCLNRGCGRWHAGEGTVYRASRSRGQVGFSSRVRGGFSFGGRIRVRLRVRTSVRVRVRVRPCPFATKQARPPTILATVIATVSAGPFAVVVHGHDGEDRGGGRHLHILGSCEGPQAARHVGHLQADAIELALRQRG